MNDREHAAPYQPRRECIAQCRLIKYSSGDAMDVFFLKK